MSDAPRNDGWWQASDGKWYPPKDRAPHPGWWLASDGKWYPPESGSADREATTASSAKPASTTKQGSTGKPGSARGTARTGRSRERNKPQPLDKAQVTPPAPKPVSERPSEPQGARPLPGPRPNVNDGLSPQEQIARRNLASQADRQVLANSRSLAASRLLASVAKEMPGSAEQKSDKTLSGAGPSTSATPAAKASSKATPPAATTKSVPKPRAERPASPNDPLLEVKQSALAADVEHLGERLAIFNDRVELRDRHDAVRQVVLGGDITDIVVNKRLTGAVLTIETVDGPVMVAKGLRPEQAEEARQLIMRKTRPSGPVQRNDRPLPAPTPKAKSEPITVEPKTITEVDTGRPATRPTPARPIDEAEVLRKLGDLHRLGILTTEEYENKIDLVGSLVRGEINLPA